MLLALHQRAAIDTAALSTLLRRLSGQAPETARAFFLSTQAIAIRPFKGASSALVGASLELWPYRMTTARARPKRATTSKPLVPRTMIICHSHRFLFIKTRKTAGSSMEIALSIACGPTDLITPLGDTLGEEQLRLSVGGYPPVNWEKPLSQYRTLREWRRFLTRGIREPILKEHATATEIRETFGQDLWNNYLKITIERNPWDHALSRYWWQKFRWERRGRKNFPPLTEYLRWLEREKPHFLSNWNHYTIHDHIAVDHVIMFEQLASGLELLKERLALPAAVKLPKRHAKGQFRPDRQHYSAVMRTQDRDLVARVCAREIEAFGYEFESPSASKY